MPLTYSIVIDIESHLQEQQLSHLQKVEQSSSVDITDREIDGWCNIAIQQRDIFTNFSTTGPSKQPYRTAADKLQSQSIHQSIDWRLSGIDVSGIDMNQPSGDNESEAPRPTRSKSFSNREYLKGRFMGYGVVRLYRDSDLDEEEDLYNKPVTKETPPGSAASIDDETVLAILAVPSYLTAYDLMGFIGTNARENVSHYRMIRTAEANRYMVLLKFRQADRAHQFYTDYNGKLFNSMEAETCHVVFVNSVLFKSEQRGDRNGDIPYLLEDPFTVADPINEIAVEEAEGNAPAETKGSTLRRISQAAAKTRRPVPPPTPALTELPTCPVCLERMDSSITGLLTIPCQHTFHCQCLSKWEDGSCPVCRYSHRGSAPRREGSCAVCHARENLWICLICGHMGCGRYDQAHAYDHYMATGHCYAMDIESQRVWDYVSDGYVHRLLQNEVDGKLVELPGSSRGPRGGDDGQIPGGMSSSSYAAADVAAAAMKAADTSEKKLDDVGLQFTQLLSSQLESQRDYYEMLLATAADKASSSQRRASAAEAENAILKSSQTELQDRTIPRLTRDLEKYKTRADKLHKLYEETLKRYTEEKLISEKTIAKLKRLEANSLERDAEMAELKEQVRDLMFFHEAQAKLADAGSDVTDGQVIIGPGKSKGKKRR